MPRGILSDLARGLGDVESNWSCRRLFLAALLVSLAVSFTGVFDHSLWSPDEPRVAEIGREMSMSGDFVVPTLAGMPFLEKPPLYWWIMTCLFRAFCASDGAARCTSAIAGVLTLLLVFDVTRRIASPFAGLMATIVAGTMTGFYVHFHRVVVDPWLALFVMLGYWGFVVAAFCGPGPGGRRLQPRAAWAIGAVYLAAGLAFLTKGPIGPILVAGPIGAAIIVGRRWDLLRSWIHVPGMILFLALCLAWPVMLYFRGGKKLLDLFAVENVLYRVIAASDPRHSRGHTRPWWYYVKSVGEILPWVIVAPAVCHWLWRRRIDQSWNRPALLFLASVFPIGIIMLSIPATKRSLYLLPLIAPLGSAIGAWIASTARNANAHKLDFYLQCPLFALPILAFVSASAAMVVACFRGTEILARMQMDVHTRPPEWAILALLAVAGVLVFMLTVRGLRLLKRRREALGPCVAWMVLVVFTLGGSLIYRACDSFKNLHHVTADLEEMNAFSRPLACYYLDEVTLGLIPFDIGRTPENLVGDEEVGRYVQENPSGRLFLIQRALRHMPDDVRCRLRLVRMWRYGRHRTYCLYEFEPCSPQTEH